MVSSPEKSLWATAARSASFWRELVQCIPPSGARAMSYRGGPYPPTQRGWGGSGAAQLRFHTSTNFRGTALRHDAAYQGGPPNKS